MPERLVIKNGEKFGRLAVIDELDRYHGPDGKPVRYFRLMCKCGTQTSASLRNLRSGSIRSCGCINKERFAEIGRSKRTHGEGAKRSSEYYSWSQMKERCCNPNKSNYSRYGGRGIQVCERWTRSFEMFLSDMGRKPSSSHTLDRIDTNGNYELSNCRWATLKEQANNRRRPVRRAIQITEV